MIVITRSKIIDSTSYKLGRIEKENVSLFLRIIPGSSLNSFEIHFTILRSCCIFTVIKWKARCALYILEFDISVKKHFVGGRCCWLEETAARPNHLLVFYSMYSTHCVFTLFDPVRGPKEAACPPRARKETGHELLSPTRLSSVLKTRRARQGGSKTKITSD